VAEETEDGEAMEAENLVDAVKEEDRSDSD
jgi:hypothetical protein